MATVSKEEHHTYIKIEYLRRKIGMEIYENLCEACGKSSFSLNTVYRWFAHFSYGKSDILDEPSYRKPVEVTDDYNVERNKGTFG